MRMLILIFVLVLVLIVVIRRLWRNMIEDIERECGEELRQGWEN
jgi:hypothetical protein